MSKPLLDGKFHLVFASSFIKTSARLWMKQSEAALVLLQTPKSLSLCTRPHLEPGVQSVCVAKTKTERILSGFLWAQVFTFPKKICLEPTTPLSPKALSRA